MIKPVTSNTKFLEDPKSRSGLTGVLGVFVLAIGTVFAYDFFMKPFVLMGFLLDLGMITGLCLLIAVTVFLAFTVRRQTLIGREGQLAIKNRFKSTLNI